MWAIKNQGHVEITKVLLEKCDWFLSDENGKTVLHFAAAVGDKAVVEMLLESISEKKVNLLDAKDGTCRLLKDTE